MAKARSRAQFYEKWTRGILETIQDKAERCDIYEYIHAFQYSKVYGSDIPIPDKENLSPAAKIVLKMLEGDVKELCDENQERIGLLREYGKKGGAPTGNQNARKQPKTTKNNPMVENQPSEEENNHEVENQPTIQNKTIQSKTNQDKTTYAGAITHLLGEKIEEFDLGLALLRKGYVIKAATLKGVYWNASVAKSPVAYAAKAFNKCESNDCGAICGNFVEATQCRDTRALEIYGCRVEDGILYVRCTADAERVIGEVGRQHAMDYAKSVGATDIRFQPNRYD